MRHFYNFSVTRIVRMIRAKNYEKLSKFVKVTAKIYCRSFFYRTRCICGYSWAPEYVTVQKKIIAYDVIHSFSSANNSLHVHT